MKPIKGFKQFINEYRSNPELNPKVSAYEAVKPYLDDPDVYISFTDIEKVGINPQSEYNTPLGIFTYPLQAISEHYNIRNQRTLTILPFAAKRPYIWILRLKDKSNFINDMYTDYTSKNFDKDEKILAKIWREEAPKNRKIFISLDFKDKVQSNKDAIEVITNKLIGLDPVDESDLVEKWKLNLKTAQMEKEELEKIRVDKIKFELWGKMYADAIASAKESNAVMSFWNLSRMVADGLSRQDYREPISASTKWNWLLRQCGYSGFADKSGRGYIHDAEPLQAVFLTRSAFTVIDKIQNKDYRDHPITIVKSVAQLIKLHLDGDIRLSALLGKVTNGYYGEYSLMGNTSQIKIPMDSYKFFSTITPSEVKQIMDLFVDSDSGGYVSDLIGDLDAFYNRVIDKFGTRNDLEEYYEKTKQLIYKKHSGK